LTKYHKKYNIVLISHLQEEVPINKGVYRHIGLGLVCRKTPFVFKEGGMEKNAIKRFGVVLLVAAIVFGFAACSDGNGGGGEQGTALAITTEDLPDGTVGAAYSQTLAAKGDKPITWNLAAGKLPAELSLAGSGAISGTPTTEGTFTFIVKATNAAGSKTKQLSITITAGGLAITPEELPDGRERTAYNQTLTATGTKPVTWSIDSGSLPEGLHLAETTGVISGTPKEADTSTFTVKAVNAVDSDTKELSITIKPFVEMVEIQNGTFTMGSPTNEPGHFTDEIQHEVTLTQIFYMGKYPVTQEQYQAVMGTNPSAYRVGGSKASALGGITDTTNFPVESVSWYNAIVFCNKLSMLEGLDPAYLIPGFNNSTDPADWGNVPTSINTTWNAVIVLAGSNGYRLPTEAEWEYACRAGKTTAFNWGTDYIDDSKANYEATEVDACNLTAGTYLDRTTEVGSYAPNEWGLYDMHGNVFERCWDWYNANYGGEAGAAVTDPVGASSGTNRVGRGGSWYYFGNNLRSAYRNYGNPSAQSDNIGFRLVRQLSIPGAPTITTTALQNGKVGTAYSRTLTAVGDASITWSLESGALPGGLSLAGSGTISGTPEAAGTSTFTVKAANATGNNIKQFSITIVDFLVEMVQIQPGTFTRGSPTTEPGRVGARETQHQVTLTQSFYLGKYEVTQEQYVAVMGTNPSYFVLPFAPETTTKKRPVENVGWYSAIVFCNKLSMLEGMDPAYRIPGYNSTDPADWGAVPENRNATWDAVEVVAGSNGYRLPTDAQWEYACRAKKETAYNWGTDIIDDSKANYQAAEVDACNLVAGTRLQRTCEVGSYAPNDWGLYDMHGNVFELCWDRFDNNYGNPTGAALTDPTGPSTGDTRVMRGGSWWSAGRSLRSALRSLDSPANRLYHTGFRLCLP
jgi:formylglycine-generating enzyme required for sulfatase activity